MLIAMMQARFDRLEALLHKIEPMIYTGTVTLPAWLGGSQTIRLKAEKPGGDGS